MKMEEEDNGGKVLNSTQLSFTNTMPTSTTGNKRLLFDRRYGWVVDEWKDPAEEALAGGRGMFCVLPLAKGLVNMASLSINVVTNSAVQILEKRDQLSPEHFQATIGGQLKQLAASVPKPVINLLSFKGKLFLPPTDSSLPQCSETNNLQEPDTV